MRRRQFIKLVGGAAAAWPLAARGQQQGSSPTRIGFLPLGSPSSGSDLSLVEAFRKGVRDGGLLEGHDVTLDVAWTQNVSEYAQEGVRVDTARRRNLSDGGFERVRYRQSADLNDPNRSVSENLSGPSSHAVYQR